MVLANLAQIDAADFAGKISKIYLADKLIFPVAIQLASDMMQKYVGRYEIEPEYIAEVMFENDSLWMQMPAREKLKLLPESESMFFFEGKEEESLTFNKNDTGKVISVTVLGTVTARRL